MDVVGHYLDIMTGEELSVIDAKLTDSGVMLASGLELATDIRARVNAPAYVKKCRVALEFVQNPEAEKAFRQMMSFDGPKVLPKVAAVWVAMPRGDFIDGTWFQ